MTIPGVGETLPVSNRRTVPSPAGTLRCTTGRSTRVSYTAVQAVTVTDLRATVNVTLKTLNAGGGPTLRICRTVV